MVASSPFKMPVMDPCAFCEIIGGREAEWSIVESTSRTTTVLNARQFETAQCMVIPNRHAPTLLDLSDDEGAAVMAAARRIAEVFIKALHPEGVLLYQNNGTGSGQEVPHFHLHVVPRNPGSDWGFGPPHIARLERGARPPHLDHEVVTDEKRATARMLRAYFDTAK